MGYIIGKNILETLWRCPEVTSIFLNVKYTDYFLSALAPGKEEPQMQAGELLQCNLNNKRGRVKNNGFVKSGNSPKIHELVSGIHS